VRGCPRWRTHLLAIRAWRQVRSGDHEGWVVSVVVDQP
jgi:hypothetical protein